VVDLQNLKVYKGVTPIVNLGYCNQCCNQSQYCNQSLMCMDYCVLVCTLRLGDLLDIQLWIISCFVNFNDLNAADGFDLLLKMFSVVAVVAVFWSNLNT
jgi:hypothetical protein